MHSTVPSLHARTQNAQHIWACSSRFSGRSRPAEGDGRGYLTLKLEITGKILDEESVYVPVQLPFLPPPVSVSQSRQCWFSPTSDGNRWLPQDFHWSDEGYLSAQPLLSVATGLNLSEGYIPKSVPSPYRVNIYYRTYWRAFSSSSKRIFNAVPSPVVCTFPHRRHLSQPTQSMIRVIFRKWALNSSLSICHNQHMSWTGDNKVNPAYISVFTLEQDWFVEISDILGYDNDILKFRQCLCIIFMGTSGAIVICRKIGT